jgi:hypothetical protein
MHRSKAVHRPISAVAALGFDREGTVHPSPQFWFWVPVYIASTPDPTYTTMSNRSVFKYHGSSSVCMPTKVALDDVRYVVVGCLQL